MLRDRTSQVRVEELHLPKHSPYVGKTLDDADFRAVGNILIIAIRKIHGDWIYNPAPDLVLEKDMHLIFLATPEERDLMKTLVEGESARNQLKNRPAGQEMARPVALTFSLIP